LWCPPYFLIGLTAKPLHQDVGVKRVGTASDETVNGRGVGTLHLCYFLAKLKHTADNLHPI